MLSIPCGGLKEPYDRHCGELVVSFGIKAVIPAKICGPLGEFVHLWVGTTQPLLDTIHQTMTSAYVTCNVPVFSSHEYGHFTVVASDTTTVAGRVIRCVNRCPITLSGSSTTLGNGRLKWRIKCNTCTFFATYALPDTISQILQEDIDPVERIGTWGYWTSYPVKTHVLEWKQSQSANETVRPVRPRSQSFSRPCSPRSSGSGTGLAVNGPTMSRVRSESGLNTGTIRRRRDSSPPAHRTDRGERRGGGIEPVQRKKPRNNRSVSTYPLCTQAYCSDHIISDPVNTV